MFHWQARSAKVPPGCWRNSPLHFSAVPRSAPDAGEDVPPAVLAEITGPAVVPVQDGAEEAPIGRAERAVVVVGPQVRWVPVMGDKQVRPRSEEHTSELQSPC